MDKDDLHWILVITALVILFSGEPDLHDALISNVFHDCPVVEGETK